MVRLLARIVGLVSKNADMAASMRLLCSRPMSDEKAVARTPADGFAG